MPGAPEDADEPRFEPWPCATPPHGPTNPPPPRLVTALYLLLRDHVQPGDLEQVMLNVRDSTSWTDFSNPHLEGYARALAAYLLEPPDPLGPEPSMFRSPEMEDSSSGAALASWGNGWTGPRANRQQR